MTKKIKTSGMPWDWRGATEVVHDPNAEPHKIPTFSYKESVYSKDHGPTSDQSPATATQQALWCADLKGGPKFN